MPFFPVLQIVEIGMEAAVRFRHLTATIVAVAFCGFVAGSVYAEEPYGELLDQLRARGWHDTALLLLEQIEGRPNLPADLRQVLPYEKARSLIDAASETHDLGKRQQQLDQARQNLEAFLTANPNHPLAAEASMQFGKLTLERGRVAVLQAEQPANQGQRKEFQEQARKQFTEAERLLQQARDQYYERYKAFPTSIREGDARYEQRRQALERYLHALMQVTIVKYETAQSYDRDDPQRKKILQQAADEFEKIHEDHRTVGAGLYARLYQGKCYEEMDDVRKARGIYDELLGHNPFESNQSRENQQFMQQLQHQAQYFRLICLNHPSTKDYQLVVDEAEQWLRENGPLRTHALGLGIQWELAKALEALGQQQRAGSGAQDRLLRRASSAAEQVAALPNEHREAAREMFGRLRGRTRDPGEEVKTFAEARDLAEAALSQEHWDEAAGYWRKALELADAETASEDVNMARLKLSFVYYQMKRSYDAAVVADYVARRFPELSIALDAAFFEMASYLQAYNEGGGDVAFETNQMIRAAEYLAARWPQSSEADQARMILGVMYSQRGEPETAAGWFLKVPEGSQHFLESRQKAGGAYWSAYLKGLQQPKAQRPNQEVLEGYRNSARQVLESSVAEARGKLAPAVQPSPELLTAELYLCQVYDYENEYNKALQLLVRPNGTGILDAVQSGKRSDLKDAFAAEVYKTALRTFLGVGDLNRARQLLPRLEELGDRAGSMAQVYRDLGGELQKQIVQLRAAGNQQQLQSVVKTFESFLAQLWAEHQQKPLSFYTLSWVAQAYYDLGDGIAPMHDSTTAQDQMARPYFQRAVEILEEVVRRAGQDAQYLPTAEPGKWDPRDVLQLRLATYKRRLGDAQACEEAYQDHLRPLLERLAGEPSKALEPQIEAAYVFQAWAAHNPSLWQGAIAGHQDQGGNAGKPVELWGWAGIARRLQSSPSARKGGAHYSTYFEAVYNLVLCRQQWAQSESDSVKRRQLLARAEQQLRLAHRLSPDLGGPEWLARFDRLLRAIQTDQGEPATGLEAR